MQLLPCMIGKGLERHLDALTSGNFRILAGAGMHGKTLREKGRVCIAHDAAATGGQGLVRNEHDTATAGARMGAEITSIWRTTSNFSSRLTWRLDSQGALQMREARGVVAFDRLFELFDGLRFRSCCVVSIASIFLFRKETLRISFHVLIMTAFGDLLTRSRCGPSEED